MTRDYVDRPSVESGEPAPGYVIRGPYANGSFRLFRRDSDGSQHHIGTFWSYDTARDWARDRAQREGYVSAEDARAWREERYP